MPHDNEDAGLPPPKSIFGTSVKRVAVNRGGVLIVDFDEKIGTKAMTFTPAIRPVSGLLSWNCSSDSIESAVLELLKPSCSYLPASRESRLMHAIANTDLRCRTCCSANFQSWMLPGKGMSTLCCRRRNYKKRQMLIASAG